METKSISYNFEGTEMIGYLTLPDTAGPRPGVLISHEGPGLDDHAKSKADRLAALGYVAFALD